MESEIEARLSALNKKVAEFLLGFVSPIRTEFIDGKKENSGTGLLMQADENRIYCLTADHVLSPENRSTPMRVKIKHHSHVVGLRVGSKSNEYPLRRKFYNSEEVDIALAESALSGTGLVDGLDARCVPIDKILYAADITVHPDDLFFVVGFPTTKNRFGRWS